MTMTLKSLCRDQVANTATTYYTATNVTAEIRSATATNDDSSARTLSVHIVPSGGSADATNRLIKTVSIAAGKTRILYELLNKQVPAGGTIQAVADSASQVLLAIDGMEET